MAVKLTFIATALLAIAALPMLACAGASQPQATALPQSAAAQTLPGSYPRIVITGNCPFGVILANEAAYRHVVGVGPWAFMHADRHVLFRQGAGGGPRRHDPRRTGVEPGFLQSG